MVRPVWLSKHPVMNQEARENNMPLVKGKKATTKEGVRENTKREIEAGKKPAQAYAIAQSVKREEAKKLRNK